MFIFLFYKKRDNIINDTIINSGNQNNIKSEKSDINST